MNRVKVFNTVYCCSMQIFDETFFFNFNICFRKMKYESSQAGSRADLRTISSTKNSNIAAKLSQTQENLPSVSLSQNLIYSPPALKTIMNISFRNRMKSQILPTKKVGSIFESRYFKVKGSKVTSTTIEQAEGIEMILNQHIATTEQHSASV